MLLLDYPGWTQMNVAAAIIPEVVYKPTAKLVKADILLQDSSFEEHIIQKGRIRRGRPSIPVRAYLRLMFLKHYLNLSFEELVDEVTHNLMYRYFCHIPLEQKVPDDTTLVKITIRHGRENITEMMHEMIDNITNQTKHKKGK
jgi:transposase, IS5 family